MMRLVRAELSRIRARRMTWIALVVGLCFLGLNTYTAYDSARPLPIADQQEAQRQYEQAKAEWKQNHEERLADCHKMQAESPGSGLTCDESPPEQEWFGKPVSTFSSVWGQFRDGSGFLFPLLTLLLSASYVAAEFSSGSLATWLTFEPRRTRVFVSKVAAPLLVTLLGGAVLAGILAALSWSIITLVGGDTALSVSERADMGWDALRLIGFLLLCSIGGASAAFLLRHTAAVLGLVIGFVVLEQVFTAFLADKARWTVLNNVLAVLYGKREFTWVRCEPGAQAQYACVPFDEQISASQGFVVLGVVTAVMALLGWWAFQRRDVA